MPDLFKEIIPSILTTKKSVIHDDIDAKDYTPFVVNRALSYHMDCVLYANEMNQRSSIDKDWQFFFYLNSIPKKKRFSKWAKKDADSKSLQLVMQYYKYSSEKAKEALNVLSVEQLTMIEEKLYKGGR
jgi:hypothetical protein